MNTLATVRRCLIVIAAGLGIYLLHWGKDFLMPLVLSLLLTDVLHPVVRYLTRWRVPHSLAAVVVTLLSAAIVLGAILLLSAQIVQLTGRLPDYRDNITAKVQALRASTGGAFARLTGTFHEITEQLSPGATTRPSGAIPTSQPATRPVPVEIVGQRSQTAVVATGLVEPVLAPLGTVGIVFTLLLFFLLDYDLITHRARWLLRAGDVGISTQTIEDASSKVGRYLRAQLIVNTCYGTLVAIALSLLGLPGALALAGIGAALRYAPYVGPLIGISLPTILAIAVFPQWFWPLMVLGILLVIELTTAMVVEPLFYGSSTGVSGIGVVVAIFFWGWVWGAMGVVLAMPITVWIVIVGRYLSGTRWLSILLSSEQIAAVENEDQHRTHTLEDRLDGWAE